MALFNRDKNKKCPHCGKKNNIYHKDQNHAFFCEFCHHPLFWDAVEQKIEADTDRCRKAHKKWAKKRAVQSAGGIFLPAVRGAPFSAHGIPGRNSHHHLMRI